MAYWEWCLWNGLGSKCLWNVLNLNKQTEATLRGGSGKLYYALKFMSLQTHGDFDAANREIQNIIRIPRSAAVVQYYGWFQVGKWAIVGMELCSGDLSDFKSSSMYRNATPLKKTIYNWEILKDTADGLAECHSRGLIHRDLKPTNSTNSRFATDHNSSLPKF